MMPYLDISLKSILGRKILLLIKEETKMCDLTITIHFSHCRYVKQGKCLAVYVEYYLEDMEHMKCLHQLQESMWAEDTFFPFVKSCQASLFLNSDVIYLKFCSLGLPVERTI